MLKSINHWSFPKDMPLETVFEHTSKAGFDAIELILNEPGKIGPTTLSKPSELEEMARLARSYGIQIRSLAGGFDVWNNSLASADKDARDRGRGMFSRLMETANIMGVDAVLVIPAFVKEAEASYDDCYRRSQEQLALLATDAEKLKVNLCIENIWNRFLLSPLEMARYVDELNSSHIGVYFDVGNILQYGYPDQWIKILNKRIKRVHVKDFKSNVGNITGFVPLLAGSVDWPAVVNALRGIGYEDALTAELSAYAHYPLQLIYDTARHLDVILTGKVR